jgi:hypothetical protein
MRDNGGVDPQEVERLQALVRGRLAQFAQAGGYIKSSGQERGAPKWLLAAREQFKAARVWRLAGEQEHWQEMMWDALGAVGDPHHRLSVAFGPSGTMVGAASYRKQHYDENRRMDRLYPEAYLAHIGTNGALRGAGTALLLEVAKLALAAERPAFAYVSRAGGFYAELGWEMIKADPSNDYWLWPLEACMEVVAAAEKDEQGLGKEPAGVD